jgi:hypothetical protein
MFFPQILFPSFNPHQMEITENNPIGNVVKAVETPVIPAPNPIAKQFIANANPKNIDSFNEMILSSFTSAKTE